MLFLHRRILLSQVAAIAIVIAAIVSTGAAQSPLGRKLEAFQLQDLRGKKYELADFRDSKLVVLAFLGTECPLAKRYGQRLGQLADEYEPRGVSFIGLNANVQDSVTEMASFARDHDIRFPLLKDLANQGGSRRFYRL